MTTWQVVTRQVCYMCITSNMNKAHTVCAEQDVKAEENVASEMRCLFLSIADV